MVFLTVANLVRSKGRDPFFLKQQILRQAGKYFGRRRNCYMIAVRNVEKALEHAVEGRKQKKKDRKELWVQRVTAGAEEHHAGYYTLSHGLGKCNILLNKKTLSELAIFEPRTFQCLVDIAKAKQFLDLPPEKSGVEEMPPGVIPRGLL